MTRGKKILARSLAISGAFLSTVAANAKQIDHESANATDTQPLLIASMNPPPTGCWRAIPCTGGKAEIFILQESKRFGIGGAAIRLTTTDQSGRACAQILMPPGRNGMTKSFGMLQFYAKGNMNDRLNVRFCMVDKNGTGKLISKEIPLTKFEASSPAEGWTGYKARCKELEDPDINKGAVVRRITFDFSNTKGEIIIGQATISEYNNQVLPVALDMEPVKCDEATKCE